MNLKDKKGRMSRRMKSDKHYSAFLKSLKTRPHGTRYVGDGQVHGDEISSQMKSYIASKRAKHETNAARRDRGEKTGNVRY